MRLILGVVILAGVGLFAYTGLAPKIALPPVPDEQLLELPDGRARLTAGQRSDTELPGSAGRLRVQLGEITREQVELTLAHTDGRALIAAQSVQRGTRLPFRLGGQRYELVVVELNNKLAGVDFAVIDVVVGVAEASRIEALLDAMKSSEGLVFIRNGKEYAGPEAADHLRRKWNATADRIRTAEQFIEFLATKSSMSGKAYTIRLASGDVVPSAQWLQARLNPKAAPASNAMRAIHPYKHEGLWVFDDADVGLSKEPFIAGADNAIDIALEAKGIRNPESGFRLVFSAGEFPGHDFRFDWVREADGGNWYRCDALRDLDEAWLCPALLKYFDKAPKRIYAKFESRE